MIPAVGSKNLFSQIKCGIIEIMKAEYKRTNYPSDLSDREWEKIKEFFPAGNKSKYDKRNLVEAVIYVVKTGCQWRALPHDYPPYSTVYNFYSRAK